LLDPSCSILTTEEVLAFLNQIYNGTRQGEKSSRFAYLRSFFNFIRDNMDHDFQNPCDAPMFKMIFRPADATQWNILDSVFRHPETDRKSKIYLLNGRYKRLMYAVCWAYLFGLISVS